MTEATFREIKATAQQLMHTHGTAGLSIRAIAREMDITPPAIYHYFPSLDVLITALIVDSFTAYTQAIQAAREVAAQAGQTLSQQLLMITDAIWRWAVENPVNFQLIYGNPIPGYHAPEEITTPLARSVGTAGFEIVLEAIRQNMINVPEHLKHIPPSVRTHYHQRMGTDDETVMTAYHLINTAWITLFGLVMLHINGHLHPVVEDVEAFFQHQAVFLLRNIGLDV